MFFAPGWILAKNKLLNHKKVNEFSETPAF